jgi:hypothetical protein
VNFGVRKKLKKISECSKELIEKNKKNPGMAIGSLFINVIFPPSL